MKLLFSIITAILMTIATSSDSVHQFNVKTIEGDEISLKQYEGKVLLLVNTASKCGYTPQYTELEKLYNTYKDKGLVIIGFPANNFMGQEPGSNEEIKAFCEKNYGVSFPMMSKISVKGSDIHPLYDFLTDSDKNGVVDGNVKWNFQKYLVGKDGKVVKKFNPGDNPMSEEVKEAIEALL
jgi:glutathione peroxidase